MSGLRDDVARRTAMAALDRSLLVEAGAGSGKTAVMAGRVVLLLASGVDPASIAAVTFTELAAGELVQRVRAFADALGADRIPPELAVALPDGLSAAQRTALERSAPRIDEITCSTIHGFCQQLILPYPVEAGIDPGAVVMDGQQAEQMFGELADRLLWQALDGDNDSLLGQLADIEPSKTIALARGLLAQLRVQRELVTAPSQALDPLIDRFVESTAALHKFTVDEQAKEAETTQRAAHFMEMGAAIRAARMLPGQVALARLVLCQPHPGLCTKTGFKAYRTIGKWRAAAREVGRPQSAGDALFEKAAQLLTDCVNAWEEMKQQLAVAVAQQLVTELKPVLVRYQEHKRDRALLDFDDLIYAARQLLREHEPVRRALGQRFRHVLVDEFQDTDRLQSEIFWRLCGDPPAGATDMDWTASRIRAGALFLVGDPKQSIYRFRGADIAAYQAARAIFRHEGAELSIATNFRSCAPILEFVNACFAEPLDEEGQPGFTALDPFHAAASGQLCVAALDVAAANEDGDASAEQQRDAEAEAVAAMCENLIGRATVSERGAGTRPCRAGDIALLAPTGSGLWRYEEALERRGIPVATQAGKGFYRRQEVQDLIALVRVLADSRDTIALGALLRGPLVGLAEEAMLDIVMSLPRDPMHLELVPCLTVNVDPVLVRDERARTVIAQLQTLRRRINSTTPHLLLSQAVDVFRVRPILHQRHHGRAERALANVDKFLAMSRSYAAQGIAAFAAAMMFAWSDEARAPEGQPDSQEDAVTLYTMHAAKGLEWPIVVPVNAMTATQHADSMFCERTTDRLCGKVFDIALPGYEDDRETEKAELKRERVRLWYVAATRARELLVLPRLDVAPAQAAWIALLNLRLDELPPLPVLTHPAAARPATVQVHAQTREMFVAEAAQLAQAARQIHWRAPSRDEGGDSAVMVEETEAARIEAADGEAVASVQGGRERGLIMHKLFEEVLTGESAGDLEALVARAAQLAGQLLTPGQAEHLALRPAEIAECVARSLGLPDIAPLRARLQPECWVYGHAQRVDGEEVIAGIADAIHVSDVGRPDTVIDWKSDVAPSAQTLDHYQAQLSSYLAVSGARRGLIVLATSGRVIQVERLDGAS